MFYCENCKKYLVEEDRLFCFVCGDSLSFEECTPQQMEKRGYTAFPTRRESGRSDNSAKPVDASPDADESHVIGSSGASAFEELRRNYEDYINTVNVSGGDPQNSSGGRRHNEKFYNSANNNNARTVVDQQNSYTSDVSHSNNSENTADWSRRTEERQTREQNTGQDNFFSAFSVGERQGGAESSQDRTDSFAADTGIEQDSLLDDCSSENNRREGRARRDPRPRIGDGRFARGIQSMRYWPWRTIFRVIMIIVILIAIIGVVNFIWVNRAQIVEVIVRICVVLLLVGLLVRFIIRLFRGY